MPHETFLSYLLNGPNIQTGIEAGTGHGTGYRSCNEQGDHSTGHAVPALLHPFTAGTAIGTSALDCGGGYAVCSINRKRFTDDSLLKPPGIYGHVFGHHVGSERETRMPQPHHDDDVKRIAGFQLESLGVDVLVRVVSRCLADYEHIFWDERRRKLLIECLDIFVEAGWPAALRLLYRLPDALR